MSNCFIDSLIIFLLVIHFISIYKLHNSKKKFSFNKTLDIFNNKNVWLVIPILIYSICILFPYCWRNTVIQ